MVGEKILQERGRLPFGRKHFTVNAKFTPTLFFFILMLFIHTQITN